MPSLDYLPVDILYEIHHLSLSPHLPSTNRYLHAALSRPTTTRAAYWLIERYFPAHGVRGFLSRALECGVCDGDVLREIERIWAREVDQARGMKSGKTRRRPTHNTIMHRPPPSNLPPPTHNHRRPAHPSPPLLTHLFTHYTPSPNSHRGYPLARASLHADTPLIAFLLTHGADPAEKEFLAVEIALTRRDIRVLRLLLDGPGDTSPPPPPATNDATDAATPTNGKRKRASVAADERPGSSKRARTAATRRGSKVVPVRLTQPLVDKALAVGTPSIVRYIVDEKGYMPSLRSIVKLK
ncbi:hypothetical protein QFC20_006769 [Naganishia adeliensis]|uniref:Uncharacterized protein n=1 Tax=Naganishia adeliensis TaxID=92952 RepID=A0ACC2V8V0_9TREE|nr:hypothetical protein QFC20_006769 [Naganishia adeliensis]